MGGVGRRNHPFLRPVPRPQERTVHPTVALVTISRRAIRGSKKVRDMSVNGPGSPGWRWLIREPIAVGVDRAGRVWVEDDERGWRRTRNKLVLQLALRLYTAQILGSGFLIDGEGGDGE